MQFYLEEVSPTKSDSKAGHDRRAVRAWTEYFSEQGADRQVTRHPSTLDRRELGKIRPKRYARRSLGYVMQFYLEEVSPTKSDSKAGHDRRAVRAWTEYFSEQGADRQVTRHPSTLDRRDWDGFVAWRRAGHFGKKKRKEQDEDELSPVRNRIIEMDVKAMVAMLGWASGVEEKGVPLLETNPWQVHFGNADQVIAGRKSVLREAWAAHPERFVRGVPKPKPLPEAVFINPPIPSLTTQDIAL